MNDTEAESNRGPCGISRRELMKAATGMAAGSLVIPKIAMAQSCLSNNFLQGETGDQGLRNDYPGSSSLRREATSAEMQLAEEFVLAFRGPGHQAERKSASKLFPERIPIPWSCLYGDRRSSDFLQDWDIYYASHDVPGVGLQHEITYADPLTKLTVRLVAQQFSNFPAVEWVAYFCNNGKEASPILQDILPLDTSLSCVQLSDAVVHYANGGRATPEDFKPLQRTLSADGLLRVEPGGGRSSSEFLPCFNVQVANEGMILGIGWSGEWAASFDRKEKDLLRLSSGLALTHLKLLPGEEIRTPLILALFWQGDALRGHNMLRQLILSRYRPLVDGRGAVMPICNGNWGDTSAAMHIENIRQIVSHDLPIDYYWIDAGWYGNGSWEKNPGNWEVKRDLYPQGFKPLSDLLHSSGRKLLLWFEPERVCEGTPWYTAHSEWLLEVPRDKRVYRGWVWDIPTSDPRWESQESGRNQIQENDKLFNLAIPEAREFLTDFMSARIDEFGLDCFRHDANIAPLEFWRAADAPDRQGMTEIRWVEGLYAFWDGLRAKHPNLLIDVCASGGRRLDLESLKRAVPLWRTDYSGHDTANQNHTYGLMFWFPLHSTSAGNLGVSSDYTVRSAMSSGLDCDGFLSTGDAPQISTDYRDIPFSRIKSVLEQQRTIEKYFYGNFYPLLEYNQDEDTWLAYQLDLGDGSEGLVVVLKRPESPMDTALFSLHALDPNASYKVVNLDSQQTRLQTGLSLTNQGLEMILPKHPDSALIQYARVRG